MLTTLETALQAIGEGLLRASLSGGAFILLVWLVCRAIPALSHGARTLLWWAASLKLALVLVGAPAVPLSLPGLAWTPATLVSRDITPARPAWFDRQPTAPAGTLDDPKLDAVARATDTPTPPPSGALIGKAPGSSLRLSWLQAWNAVLIAWLAIVVLHVVALGRHLYRSRRIVSRAVPADGDLTELARGLARELAVQRNTLLISDEIDVPQVTGVWNPIVLLPRHVTDLAIHERRMVVCHELAHIRRADLFWGWLPAVTERLFFFHPLAWLATREYALAREAACDQAVLRVLDATPRDYGRLIVRLGVCRQYTASAAAGASPTMNLLKRRLSMLQDPTFVSPLARLASIGLALVMLAGVPMQIVAQSPAKPPSSPSPSAAAEAKPKGGRSSWVLVHDGRTIMAQSSGDEDHLRDSSIMAKGDLFLFGRNGRTYVIDDPATLAQVESILAPQRELGRLQGQLGERQGELGTRQGELGRLQGELGAKQGELGARIGRTTADTLTVAAERARTASDPEAKERFEAELKQREAAARVRMESIEREMQVLGARQEELGRKQEELGRKQEAMGREQEALGRKQEEAARAAQPAMDALIERAIANGTARPAR